MRTHISTADNFRGAARDRSTARAGARFGAAVSATGLAAGLALAGVATAAAGAHQGPEPCSALQPGVNETVSGDVFLVPAENHGESTFAFRFGPTHGPAVVNYSVDWQNHTTGAVGTFIGSTLPEGDLSQINQTQATGGGHVTWQVTDLEIASVDRPDLGAFAGVGCEGERHLPW